MIIWEFEKKNGHWHKIFDRSVKTAFYVSRGTFWGHFNPEKIFYRFVSVFWFWRRTLAGLSNLLCTRREDHYEGFLGEILLLCLFYDFEQFLLDFLENNCRGCQNCILRDSNSKKWIFLFFLDFERTTIWLLAKTCGSVSKMHQPVPERNLRTFCEKLKTLELRAKKFQTSGKKITTGLPNMPSTRQEEHLEDFCGENIVFFPIFDCEQEVLGLLLQVFCTFSDNFSAGLSNFHSTGPRKKSV